MAEESYKKMEQKMIWGKNKMRERDGQVKTTTEILHQGLSDL